MPTVSSPRATGTPVPEPTAAQVRRGLNGLLAVRLLGALADGAMLPFIILWAHRVGGLTGSTAGLLFLAQAIGELIGGLGGGALADRLGHRRTLLFSTIGMAIGYGSLFFISTPLAAVGAFVVAGLFESAFHPTISALVGDLASDHELQRRFGRQRAAANLGRVAGPVLGAVAVAFSLHWVFAVAGLFLIGALVVIAWWVPADRLLTPEPEAVATDASPATLGLILRDRALALLILSGGLLSITFTWWEGDGLVLLRQQGPLGTTAFAALFAVAAATTIAMQRPCQQLARRFPVGGLLLAGSAIQGAGLALLAGATAGYPLLVISAIIIEAGQMLYGPSVSTFITRRAANSRGATYQAAISTTEDIGSAIGPTTGLALGNAGSPRLVWLLTIPLCVTAGLAARRATKSTGPNKPAGMRCKDGLAGLASLGSAHTRERS